MNFKHILLTLGAFAFFACSDDLGTVGSSIQPDGDKVDLKSDTIYLNNRDSIYEVSSIYSMSTTALLGNFSDKTYGDSRCDFLAQLHCNDNFNITKVAGDSLEYTTITIEYKGFTGDSIEPMQVSAYQLNNPLTKEMYSNVDISKYCDKSKLLGRKSYTAYNFKKASTTTYDTIEIKLSKEFTTNFYKELTTNRSTFLNDESFAKFFPGMYITNTFGSGSIIKVYKTSLNFYYNYISRNKKNTVDSIIPAVATIANGNEVFLANHYSNNHLSHFVTNPTPGVSYLRTPSGLFSAIKFPMKALETKVGKSKLNGAKLVINTERVNTSNTKLGVPPGLLLIRESEMKDYFANPSRTLDNRKMGVAAYSSTTNSYTFSNISPLFNDYIDKKSTYSGNDVKFVLVPVDLTIDSSTGGISAVSHLNDPKAVKFFTSADKFYLSLVIAK